MAVVLNAAITLPLAAMLNLWQDEAYTLHTTSGTIAHAFTQALAFEQNAPLYFVVLTIWRAIDGSLFFGRIFSILCISATLLLVPALCARYLPGVKQGLVTLVIALNPVTVWAALDLRAYAAIILASTLLLLVFHSAFLAPGGKVRAWTLAYGALVAISLYTQYYLGFLVAALGVTLAVRAPRMLPRYLLAALAAFATLAPVAVQIPGQIRNFQGGFGAPDSPRVAILSILDILGHYVLPIHAFGRALGIALIVAIIAALVYVFARYFTPRADPLILLVTGAGILIAGCALYVEGVHLLNRHLVAFFVPAMLSTFAVLSYLREPINRTAQRTWASLSIVLSVITLFATYASLAKPGDWIRATSFIAQHEATGEPIAIFEAEQALPFEYYYRGANEVVPIPSAIDFRSYDVRRFIIHDADQVARSLPSSRKIWLVTAGECTAANVDFGCDIVERYVAQHYRERVYASFHGSEVRLLERRSDSAGRLIGR